MYSFFWFCAGFGTCFFVLFIVALFKRNDTQYNKLTDKIDIDQLSKNNQSKTGL